MPPPALTGRVSALAGLGMEKLEELIEEQPVLDLSITLDDQRVYIQKIYADGLLIKGWKQP